MFSLLLEEASFLHEIHFGLVNSLKLLQMDSSKALKVLKLSLLGSRWNFQSKGVVSAIKSPHQQKIDKKIIQAIETNALRPGELQHFFIFVIAKEPLWVRKVVEERKSMMENAIDHLFDRLEDSYSRQADWKLGMGFLCMALLSDSSHWVEYFSQRKHKLIKILNDSGNNPLPIQLKGNIPHQVIKHSFNSIPKICS